MFSEGVSRLNLMLHDFGCASNNTTNTLAVGFVVCIVVYWLIRRRKYHFPPGPIGLPILGYLPFLAKEPHKVIDRLCKKYGNVIGLNMGQTYVVFLGDYDTVKEAFSQSATLGRPNDFMDFLPDGAGFTLANSTEWSEQRRYAVRAMRDVGLGGSKWEALLQEEINDILNFIKERNGNPMNCFKLLSESISNNIATLVFGNRIPPGDPARKLFDEIVTIAVEEADVSAMRNFFPLISDFLSKLGIGAQDKDLHLKFTEFTDFVKNKVEERKKLRDNEDTFVDGYLKEIDDNIKNSLNNTFNERNLRGTTMTLLTAGTDTSTASLLWLFIAMALYPELQEKVHQELDAVLGKDGQAKYQERSKLPYCNAVLLENSRWAPIVPLGVVRVALEDTKISGYDVLKGTWVIPNLWAILMNPKKWKDPNHFMPERFLSDKGEVISSKIDSYIPFSYGKRNCPGETVARITAFLYFTSIMQKFKVLPPVGQKPRLEAKPGITYRPVDQELRFILRD